MHIPAFFLATHPYINPVALRYQRFFACIVKAVMRAVLKLYCGCLSLNHYAEYHFLIC